MLRLAAKADAQVVLHVKVLAGHQQHALLVAEPLNTFVEAKEINGAAGLAFTVTVALLLPVIGQPFVSFPALTE